MEDNKKIAIMNRHTGFVGYTLPELGIRRQFSPGEEKKITYEELRSLQGVRGGSKLLEKYFVVKDDEAIQEIYNKVEPEYYYTPKDIKRMLTTASYEEFLDCLDFAPGGVLEMIQEMAVNMELNDIKKREAIFEKTGLNITEAIQVRKYKNDGDEDTEEVAIEKPKRRVSAETTEAPKRRTESPKYSYSKTEE